MKPFSALMYITKNKLRCFVLILMMSFVTVVFLGGMYIDNPGEVFRIELEQPNTYMIARPRGSSNEAIDQYRELRDSLSSILPENLSEVIYVSIENTSFDSLIGFNCTTQNIWFQSEEDFILFRDRTGYLPKDLVIHDKEIVMTELLANNRGYKIGDKLGKDKKLTLSSFVEDKGMKLYVVDTDLKTGAFLVMSKDGVVDQNLHDELERICRDLSAKYPLVSIWTNSTNLEEVSAEFSFMYIVMGAVVVLVAIVLLVTINAAFTAAFDKRKYEFSIYKAMGYTSGQIFRKVACEALLMGAAGMILGVLMNAGVILVANELLWEKGQRFFRISPCAVIACLVTEVLVIVPVIFLNWHKVKKCEVTEY